MNEKSNSLMMSYRGFSLFELLVTVALLAIIAAVAMPSYRAYLVRADRADAKSVLSEAGVWLERNYTSSGCYNRTSVATCASQAGVDLALPFAQAPKSGTAKYAIAVAFANSGQSYTLSATPTGGFADAECGVLSLNQTGTQSVSGTASVATCWQK